MVRKKSGGDIAFEDALAQLEQTVAQLEEGDMKLDDAIELFGRGMELAAVCDKKLAAAQQRVEKIVEDAKGEYVLQPLLMTEE